MEARALGRLLDEKNHTLCLNCKSSKLFHLISWTIYLLLLRALCFLPQCVKILPQWLQAHITRVEGRIVNIAISIIQIISGRNISYTSFSRSKYRSSHRQDGSYEGSITSTGPADDLMAPGDSSLDSSIETNYIPPQVFAHRPDVAYLRPQAPRPPYLRRNYENTRRSSSLVSPLPSAIIANDRRRNNNNHVLQLQSRSLDGAVSPASFAEPIPRMPPPPVPVFIARMPFISVSDSIYSSSCSTQRPTAPSEVQTYIDLLPRRSFEDSEGLCQGCASDGDNAGYRPSVPALFRSDAQHGALAAVAQRYATMNYRRSRNARSSSAPVPQSTAKNSKL